MSLNDWAKSGWLKPQQPTRDQIAKIFGVVDRDLEDSKRRNLSPDGQFNMPTAEAILGLSRHVRRARISAEKAERAETGRRKSRRDSPRRAAKREVEAKVADDGDRKPQNLAVR